jgi:ABC-type uncharacterized transport system permease subunit
MGGGAEPMTTIIIAFVLAFLAGVVTGILRGRR